MGSLTKADLAKNLVSAVGLTKTDARDLVEGFFDVIRDTLVKRQQVKLSGFGNFVVCEKNKRPGRNPKTGEEILITARSVVTFRPGQKLKSKVDKYMLE